MSTLHTEGIITIAAERNGKPSKSEEMLWKCLEKSFQNDPRIRLWRPQATCTKGQGFTMIPLGTCPAGGKPTLVGDLREFTTCLQFDNFASTDEAFNFVVHGIRWSAERAHLPSMVASVKVYVNWLCYDHSANLKYSFLFYSISIQLRCGVPSRQQTLWKMRGP